MVRQCAWCLCLIDGYGERISDAPFPKMYEASHGMCGVCGTRWMEQVVGEQGSQSKSQTEEEQPPPTQTKTRQNPLQSITALILQLQQDEENESPQLILPELKGPVTIV